ncbi:MAG: hypothetical protein KGP35_02200 [Bacteroidetes bacterium]|nr:hypothetical protein [Bacteroidota bacterium]
MASPKPVARKNKPYPHISRLVIDNQFRIWLPDFNQLEIQLTPLPKTLYLFLLKNPEGIMFKELSQHRKELLSIYSKTGNRLNLEQMKKSINDMTDIRSNSIHEKCSRIRAAFTTRLSDSNARHYYILGERNQPKKILLPASLIFLPDNF